MNHKYTPVYHLIYTIVYSKKKISSFSRLYNTISTHHPSQLELRIVRVRANWERDLSYWKKWEERKGVTPFYFFSIHYSAIFPARNSLSILQVL